MVFPYGFFHFLFPVFLSQAKFKPHLDKVYNLQVRLYQRLSLNNKHMIRKVSKAFCQIYVTVLFCYQDWLYYKKQQVFNCFLLRWGSCHCAAWGHDKHPVLITSATESHYSSVMNVEVLLTLPDNIFLT